VHNVETLLRVPEALADPPAFRQAERTLVSLWGHVRRPGVFEVPLGTPLREVVERYGEGAPAGIGFYFPAGPSALPLLATEGGTPLDPDELRARGSGLGTAALLVVREGACPVSLASSLASFFARESCGQCPPCAVGTSNLARVLGAVEAGEARPRDLDTLAEVAGFMGDHGYCAHGRTAAAVVTGLLRRCAAAVQAHLRAARCPGPDGQLDPFHPSSPERAAIEATLEGASPLP
jgi:NADH-quinone oxidoreductase subunit F